MAGHESEERLSAYLDGQLSAGEADGARSHLSACGACRAVLDGLKAGQALLRRAPRRPMPAGVAASIQRLADARGASRWPLPDLRWVWAPSWVPAMGMAAAALVLGLATWTWVRAARQQIPIEPLLAAHQRYAAEGVLAAANPTPTDFAATLTSSESEADN